MGIGNKRLVCFTVLIVFLLGSLPLILGQFATMTFSPPTSALNCGDSCKEGGVCPGACPCGIHPDDVNVNITDDLARFVCGGILSSIPSRFSGPTSVITGPQSAIYNFSREVFGRSIIIGTSTQQYIDSNKDSFFQELRVKTKDEIERDIRKIVSRKFFSTSVRDSDIDLFRHLLKVGSPSFKSELEAELIGYLDRRTVIVPYLEDDLGEKVEPYILYPLVQNPDLKNKIVEILKKSLEYQTGRGWRIVLNGIRFNLFRGQGQVVLPYPSDPTPELDQLFDRLISLSLVSKEPLDFWGVQYVGDFTPYDSSWFNKWIDVARRSPLVENINEVVIKHIMKIPPYNYRITDFLKSKNLHTDVSYNVVKRALDENTNVENIFMVSSFYPDYFSNYLDQKEIEDIVSILSGNLQYVQRVFTKNIISVILNKVENLAIEYPRMDEIVGNKINLATGFLKGFDKSNSPTSFLTADERLFYIEEFLKTIKKMTVYAPYTPLRETIIDGGYSKVTPGLLLFKTELNKLESALDYLSDEQGYYIQLFKAPLGGTDFWTDSKKKLSYNLWKADLYNRIINHFYRQVSSQLDSLENRGINIIITSVSNAHINRLYQKSLPMYASILQKYRPLLPGIPGIGTEFWSGLSIEDKLKSHINNFVPESLRLFSDDDIDPLVLNYVNSVSGDVNDLVTQVRDIVETLEGSTIKIIGLKDVIESRLADGIKYNEDIVNPFIDLLLTELLFDEATEEYRGHIIGLLRRIFWNQTLPDSSINNLIRYVKNSNNPERGAIALILERTRSSLVIPAFKGILCDPSEQDSLFLETVVRTLRRLNAYDETTTNCLKRAKQNIDQQVSTNPNSPSFISTQTEIGDTIRFIETGIETSNLQNQKNPSPSPAKSTSFNSAGYQQYKDALALIEEGDKKKQGGQLAEALNFYTLARNTIKELVASKPYGIPTGQETITGETLKEKLTLVNSRIAEVLSSIQNSETINAQVDLLFDSAELSYLNGDFDSALKIYNDIKEIATTKLSVQRESNTILSDSYTGIALVFLAQGEQYKKQYSEEKSKLSTEAERLLKRISTSSDAVLQFLGDALKFNPQNKVAKDGLRMSQLENLNWMASAYGKQADVIAEKMINEARGTYAADFSGGFWSDTGEVIWSILQFNPFKFAEYYAGRHDIPIIPKDEEAKKREKPIGYVLDDLIDQFKSALSDTQKALLFITKMMQDHGLLLNDIIDVSEGEGKSKYRVHVVDRLKELVKKYPGVDPELVEQNFKTILSGLLHLIQNPDIERLAALSKGTGYYEKQSRLFSADSEPAYQVAKEWLGKKIARGFEYLGFDLSGDNPIYDKNFYYNPADESWIRTIVDFGTVETFASIAIGELKVGRALLGLGRAASAIPGLARSVEWLARLGITDATVLGELFKILPAKALSWSPLGGKRLLDLTPFHKWVWGNLAVSVGATALGFWLDPTEDNRFARIGLMTYGGKSIADLTDFFSSSERIIAEKISSGAIKAGPLVQKALQERLRSKLIAKGGKVESVEDIRRLAKEAAEEVGLPVIPRMISALPEDSEITAKVTVISGDLDIGDGVIRSEVVLGRGNQANWKTKNGYVSGQHAKLFTTEDGGIGLRNLQTQEKAAENLGNTYVNGRKLSPGEEVVLKQGDEVSLASPEKGVKFRIGIGSSNSQVPMLSVKRSAEITFVKKPYDQFVAEDLNKLFGPDVLDPFSIDSEELYNLLTQTISKDPESVYNLVHHYIRGDAARQADIVKRIADMINSRRGFFSRKVKPKDVENKIMTYRSFLSLYAKTPAFRISKPIPKFRLVDEAVRQRLGKHGIELAHGTNDPRALLNIILEGRIKTQAMRETVGPIYYYAPGEPVPGIVVSSYGYGPYYVELFSVGDEVAFGGGIFSQRHAYYIVPNTETKVAMQEALDEALEKGIIQDRADMTAEEYVKWAKSKIVTYEERLRLPSRLGSPLPKSPITSALAQAVSKLTSTPLRTIKRLPTAVSRKVVAIGDVHGDLDGLKEMLIATGLIDARGAWIGGNAKLIQIGDVIDRGPNSIEAYNYLELLQEEAAASGGQVVRLLGNHELFLLQGNLDYALRVMTMDQILKLTQRLSDDIIDGKIVASYVDGGHVFVHAGISNAVADRVAQRLGKQVSQLTPKELSDELNKMLVEGVNIGKVTRDDSIIFAVGKSRYDPMDPDRLRAPDIGGIFWADLKRELPSEQSPFHQIVGHVPPEGADPKIRLGQGERIIGIDAGMYEGYGGGRAALVLEGSEAKAVEPVQDVLDEFRRARNKGDDLPPPVGPVPTPPPNIPPAPFSSNAERMSPGFKGEGGMINLLLGESIGGNAGNFRGYLAGAANFVFDPKTGEIVYFDNIQNLPDAIRSMVDAGLYRHGTFRAALDTHSKGEREWRIVNIYIEGASPEARQVIEASVDDFNKRFGFEIPDLPPTTDVGGGAVSVDELVDNVDEAVETALREVQSEQSRKAIENIIKFTREAGLPTEQLQAQLPVRLPEYIPILSVGRVEATEGFRLLPQETRRKLLEIQDGLLQDVQELGHTRILAQRISAGESGVPAFGVWQKADELQARIQFDINQIKSELRDTHEIVYKYDVETDRVTLSYKPKQTRKYYLSSDLSVQAQAVRLAFTNNFRPIRTRLTVGGVEKEVTIYFPHEEIGFGRMVEMQNSLGAEIPGYVGIRPVPGVPDTYIVATHAIYPEEEMILKFRGGDKDIKYGWSSMANMGNLFPIKQHKDALLGAISRDIKSIIQYGNKDSMDQVYNEFKNVLDELDRFVQLNKNNNWIPLTQLPGGDDIYLRYSIAIDALNALKRGHDIPLHLMRPRTVLLSLDKEFLMTRFKLTAEQLENILANPNVAAALHIYDEIVQTEWQAFATLNSNIDSSRFGLSIQASLAQDGLLPASVHTHPQIYDELRALTPSSGDYLHYMVNSDGMMTSADGVQTGYLFNMIVTGQGPNKYTVINVLSDTNQPTRAPDPLDIGSDIRPNYVFGIEYSNGVPSAHLEFPGGLPNRAKSINDVSIKPFAGVSIRLPGNMLGKTGGKAGPDLNGPLGRSGNRFLGIMGALGIGTSIVAGPEIAQASEQESEIPLSEKVPAYSSLLDPDVPEEVINSALDQAALFVNSELVDKMVKIFFDSNNAYSSELEIKAGQKLIEVSGNPASSRFTQQAHIFNQDLLHLAEEGKEIDPEKLKKLNIVRKFLELKGEQLKLLDKLPLEEVCDSNVQAGKYEEAGDRRLVNLGATQGTFKVKYNMLKVPDKIDVYYEGREIFTSKNAVSCDNRFAGGGLQLGVLGAAAGCIIQGLDAGPIQCGKCGGWRLDSSTEYEVNFGPGTSTKAEVVVTTPKDSKGAYKDTAWQYHLSCPPGYMPPKKLSNFYILSSDIYSDGLRKIALKTILESGEVIGGADTNLDTYIINNTIFFKNLLRFGTEKQIKEFVKNKPTNIINYFTSIINKLKSKISFDVYRSVTETPQIIDLLGILISENAAARSKAVNILQDLLSVGRGIYADSVLVDILITAFFLEPYEAGKLTIITSIPVTLLSNEKIFQLIADIAKDERGQYSDQLLLKTAAINYITYSGDPRAIEIIKDLSKKDEIKFAQAGEALQIQPVSVPATIELNQQLNIQLSIPEANKNINKVDKVDAIVKTDSSVLNVTMVETGANTGKFVFDTPVHVVGPECRTQKIGCPQTGIKVVATKAEDVKVSVGGTDISIDVGSQQTTETAFIDPKLLPIIRAFEASSGSSAQSLDKKRIVVNILDAPITPNIKSVSFGKGDVPARVSSSKKEIILGTDNFVSSIEWSITSVGECTVNLKCSWCGIKITSCQEEYARIDIKLYKDGREVGSATTGRSGHDEYDVDTGSFTFNKFADKVEVTFTRYDHLDDYDYLESSVSVNTYSNPTTPTSSEAFSLVVENGTVKASLFGSLSNPTTRIVILKSLLEKIKTTPQNQLQPTILAAIATGAIKVLDSSGNDLLETLRRQGVDLLNLFSDIYGPLGIADIKPGETKRLDNFLGEAGTLKAAICPASLQCSGQILRFFVPDSAIYSGVPYKGIIVNLAGIPTGSCIVNPNNFPDGMKTGLSTYGVDCNSIVIPTGEKSKVLEFDGTDTQEFVPEKPGSEITKVVFGCLDKQPSTHSKIDYIISSFSQLDFDFSDIKIDSSGNLYVTGKTMQGSFKIVKINKAGQITPLDLSGLTPHSPNKIALDSSDNLYVTDVFTVKKIFPDGTITTVAGTGKRGMYYEGDPDIQPPDYSGPATQTNLGLLEDITTDSRGNIYILDGYSVRDKVGNYKIARQLLRKIDPSGNIKTITQNLRDAINIFADDNGNVYVSTIGSSNNFVKKISPDGTITTVAGTGERGFSGDGGSATSAKLSEPRDMIMDAAGNLYLVDGDNARIRKIDTNGIITIAGNGYEGDSGRDGPATSVRIAPRSLAMDSSGNLFLTDGYSIRKLTPISSFKTTLVTGGDNLLESILPVGRVSDVSDNIGRKFKTTVILKNKGTLPIGPEVQIPFSLDIQEYEGDWNQYNLYTNINLPLRPGEIKIADLIFDIPSNIVLKDTYSYNVYAYRLTTHPQWNLIANLDILMSGSPTVSSTNTINAEHYYNLLIDEVVGSDDLTRGKAIFSVKVKNPNNFDINSVSVKATVTVSGEDRSFTLEGTNNNVLIRQGETGVVDFFIPVPEELKEIINRRRPYNIPTKLTIEKITGTTTSFKTISLFSGEDLGEKEITGCQDQVLRINKVADKIKLQTLTGAGGKATIYYTDTPTRTITTIAGNGMSGNSGDGGNATRAQFNVPTNVEVDSAKNVYILDVAASMDVSPTIRKIDSSTGNIETIAGDPSGSVAENIQARNARLYGSKDLALDSSGNIYILQEGAGGMVRKIDKSTGLITTIAGEPYGSQRSVNAIFYKPVSMDIDSSGNIYVADGEARRIIKISPPSTQSQTWTPVVIAGTPEGGIAASSELTPSFIAVDNSGNIYFIEYGGRADLPDKIKKIDATGHISTIIEINRGGDWKRMPYDIQTDSFGNIFYTTAATIERIDRGTNISTTIAGTGERGYSGDGGHPLYAQFNYPKGLAIDSSGNIYVADADNRRVRKVTVPTQRAISPITMPPSGADSFDAGIGAGVEVIPENSETIPFSDIETKIFNRTNIISITRLSFECRHPNLYEVPELSVFVKYNNSQEKVQAIFDENRVAVVNCTKTEVFLNITDLEFLELNSLSSSGGLVTVYYKEKRPEIPPSPITPSATPSATDLELKNVRFVENVLVQPTASALPLGVPISQCGVITESGYLTKNITTTKMNCFSIKADNVVLDGNGFSIIGNGPKNHFAIYSLYRNGTDGFDNITIKNTNIGGFGGGIYLSGSDGSRIVNNKIYISGNDSGFYGIQLSQSNFNVVESNTIISSDYTGGLSVEDLVSSKINSNTIVTSGRSGKGLYIENVKYSTINYNTITTRGNDAVGISMFYGGSNNFDSNTITTSGQSATGITLSGSSDNVFDGDYVTVSSTSAQKYTISPDSLKNIINLSPTLPIPTSKPPETNPKFEVNLCVHGDSSINQLFGTTQPLHADVVNVNGEKLPLGINRADIEDLKNGACKTITLIHESYPNIYKKTKKIEFILDKNNIVNESDETNNMFTCVNEICTRSVPSPSLTPTASPTPSAVPSQIVTPIISPTVPPNQTALFVPIIVTVVGNGQHNFSGDRGIATNASLRYASGVVLDYEGNIYVADNENSRIRKVDRTGIITTIAGTGERGNSRMDIGDGGLATQAKLGSPESIALDPLGNIFIVDSGTFSIRKINKSTGIITTVIGGVGLGDGVYGNFFAPKGIALDPLGNIYVADSGNHRIRKISPDGKISTIAGNGTAGYSGDAGNATKAQFNSPTRLALDPLGNIYVADSGNHRIRKISPDGKISTIAGNGTAGYSGDAGNATLARFRSPNGIAIDASGDIYISDTFSNRIRKISKDGTIATVVGTGAYGYSGDGGPPTSAMLAYPTGISIDHDGNVYIADMSNSRIRKIQLQPTQLLVDNLYSVLLNYWSYQKEYRCANDKLEDLGYKIEYEFVSGGPSYRMPVLYPPSGYPNSTIPIQPFAKPSQTIQTGCENPINNTRPFGIFEKVGTDNQTGIQYLQGWAYDADSPDMPVTVRIDGSTTNYVFTKSIAADISRPDLPAGYYLPNTSVNHGFRASLENIQDGNYIIKFIAMDPQTDQEKEIRRSPQIITITQPPAQPDFELRSVLINESSHQITVVVCGKGPKSIGDFITQENYFAFKTIKWDVIDSSGKVLGYGSSGTYPSGIGIEAVKNNRCDSFTTGIQPTEKPLYDKTKRINIKLDGDNLIQESDETNNQLTCAEGKCEILKTAPTPTPTQVSSPTPIQIPTPTPSVCSGDVSLTLSKTQVTPGEVFKATVSGLSGCDGRNAYIWQESTRSTQGWLSCSVSGSGCSVDLKAPDKENTGYLTQAAIDKNQNGNYADSGEMTGSIYYKVSQVVPTPSPTPSITPTPSPTPTPTATPPVNDFTLTISAPAEIFEGLPPLYGNENLIVTGAPQGEDLNTTHYYIFDKTKKGQASETNFDYKLVANGVGSTKTKYYQTIARDYTISVLAVSKSGKKARAEHNIKVKDIPVTTSPIAVSIGGDTGYHSSLKTIQIGVREQLRLAIISGGGSGGSGGSEQLFYYWDKDASNGLSFVPNLVNADFFDKSVEFDYTKSGTYTVTLRVADDDGSYADSTLTVIVVDKPTCTEVGDAGKDYYTAGHMFSTILVQPGLPDLITSVFSDNCIGDYKTLREYYCEGTNYKTEDFACPKTCPTDRCIT